MDHHAGRIIIIASSTMVHQRVRCMICDQPVDHRVVFMTNDARVLHAGCIPDHVKVPTTVLLQAIRRLERMVARAREDGFGSAPEGPDPGHQGPENRGPEERAPEDRDPQHRGPEERGPDHGGPQHRDSEGRGPGSTPP
jgi:hypothetical protein